MKSSFLKFAIVLAVAATSAFRAEAAGLFLPPSAEARELTALAPFPAVEEEVLGERMSQPVGVMAPGDVGFSEDFWKGYDRGNLLAALDGVKRLPPSPSLVAIMRNALLMTSPLPEGWGPDDADIHLARTRALMRAGMLKDASRLAQAWPTVPAREDFARTLAEAMFLAGDNDAACLGVRSLQNAFSGPFWFKAQAACQFLSGETQAGLLSLDMLREREMAEDASFLKIAEAMVVGNRPDIAITAPDALLFAMMRIGGFPLPETATKGNPVLTAVFALAEGTAPQFRLKAGMEAASVEIIDGKTLMGILEAVPFDAREIKNAFDVADGGIYGIRLVALVHQALLFQPRTGKDDAKRVALIGKALAAAPVLTGGVADVFRHMIAPLPPDASPQIAVDAAALFYLAGDDEMAGTWRDAALRSSDAGVVAAAHRLWPFAVLAGHADMGGLSTWMAEQEREGDGAGRRIVRVLAVLSAMGLEVSPETFETWAQDESGQVRNPALVAALEQAADEGQQGRSLMLASKLLSAGVQQAPVDSLRAVLKALRELKMEDAARALAREAIVSAL